jgi:ElaB/YqjD/DUF883 family membrane-anchored ribosome-binding protein
MENQIPVSDAAQDHPEQEPHLYESLPEPLQEIGKKATTAFREFQESETWKRIIETRGKARDYITENPVNSFFYALGTGFLVGFLLKKRK